MPRPALGQPRPGSFLPFSPFCPAARRSSSPPTAQSSATPSPNPNGCAEPGSRGAGSARLALVPLPRPLGKRTPRTPSKAANFKFRLIGNEPAPEGCGAEAGRQRGAHGGTSRGPPAALEQPRGRDPRGPERCGASANSRDLLRHRGSLQTPGLSSAITALLTHRLPRDAPARAILSPGIPCPHRPSCLQGRPTWKRPHGMRNPCPNTMAGPSPAHPRLSPRSQPRRPQTANPLPSPPRALSALPQHGAAGLASRPP